MTIDDPIVVVGVVDACDVIVVAGWSTDCVVRGVVNPPDVIRVTLEG